MKISAADSRWRDGDAQVGRIFGTGSISCRPMLEDDAADAAAKRGPIGFASAQAEGGFEELLEAETERLLTEQAAALEAELVSWGEALWTSRDLATEFVSRSAIGRLP